MKHYVMSTSQKSIDSDLIEWIEFSEIPCVSCDENDSIWVSTLHKNWRENIIAASAKCRNVVLLTYHYDRPEMQTALLLGARGYCHALSQQSLFESVSRVLKEGGIWVPNELYVNTTSAVATTLDLKVKIPEIATLTAREKDVLTGILEGLSNKEIARNLKLTERTIKEHVGSLLKKLNAKDRIGLLLSLGEFSHLKDAL
ncbi:response regulator transcription factor [Alteromonas naphthalenivorans]|uniref:LuxR-family transcriptional regulator n=1 Tax=Alteromonas naphthalenivorans TaxID=715451 RepID=F5Z4H1_ALTNA|nr:response regulator transcription factor [Alteromonas naphthalenivorans]AEF04230.1 putative LuxR-family transcriptional regulator [Alteromonas naphthalenivorans]